VRERTIEIKLIKKQFCYREKKLKEQEEQACPYDYEEFKDSCINCRWYGENVISREDVEKLKDINQKVLDVLEILKKLE
jgi:D-lyxose ketol-isomerase